MATNENYDFMVDNDYGLNLPNYYTKRKLRPIQKTAKAKKQPEREVSYEGFLGEDVTIPKPPRYYQDPYSSQPRSRSYDYYEAIEAERRRIEQNQKMERYRTPEWNDYKARAQWMPREEIEEIEKKDIFAFKAEDVTAKAEENASYEKRINDIMNTVFHVVCLSSLSIKSAKPINVIERDNVTQVKFTFSSYHYDIGELAFASKEDAVAKLACCLKKQMDESAVQFKRFHDLYNNLNKNSDDFVKVEK